MFVSGSGETWNVQCQQSIDTPDTLRALLSGLFKAQVYRDIRDFDDFLSDASVDWTNSGLFKKSHLD